MCVFLLNYLFKDKFIKAEEIIYNIIFVKIDIIVNYEGVFTNFYKYKFLTSKIPYLNFTLYMQFTILIFSVSIIGKSL